MRKHYATFYSPGTLFSESTSVEVAERDPKLAVAELEKIVERYNAKPYAFTLETRIVRDPVPDGEGGTLDVVPKTVDDVTGLHLLGGTLETWHEVEARNDPRESIMRSNMRVNGMWIVCVNTNSFRLTIPFGERDVIVDATGAIVERGDDPKHVAYRAMCAKEREARL